jgi:hypothetical protein
LLRYALRPPLSLERLTRAGDGRVVLSLRRPLYDGTTAVTFAPSGRRPVRMPLRSVSYFGFTPMDLTKRLAALVPPPKRHSARCFGAFAANAGIRARVIRKPIERRRRRGCGSAPEEGGTRLDDEALRAALRDDLGFDPLAVGPPPMPQRARRLDYPPGAHRPDLGRSAKKAVRSSLARGGSSSSSGGGWCTEERGPNNVHTQANALGAAACGSLSHSDLRDWYSWSITGSAPYSIQLSSNGDAQVVMWKLINGRYSQVANTTATSIARTSAGSGKYVLVVLTPNGDSQSYRLTLTK